MRRGGRAGSSITVPELPWLRAKERALEEQRRPAEEESAREAIRNPERYLVGYPSLVLAGKEARISKEDFERLQRNEYSGTIPTGVYVGKCWYRNDRAGDWLGSYEWAEGSGTEVRTRWRRLVVTNA